MITAIAIYRCALRLLPASLRIQFGDEMELMFHTELGAARAHGRLAALRFTCRALLDVVTRAPAEHWRRRGRYTHKETRMSFLFSDIRFAARSFLRQPGATALIVVTLSLAVAANTAVFTLLDGVFFRPFPFPQPSRLVYLNEKAPRWNLDFTGVSFVDFDGWRQRAQDFEAMGLWNESSVNLATERSVERVDAANVTYDLPITLGIHPLLGRFFTADEDKPHGPNVVAIGYALWQQRFAGTRDVIGKTLRINSAAYTIVGVLPREAEFPSGAKLWLPLDEDPKSTNQSYMYDGVGRLKPGITVARAENDLDRAQLPIWNARDTAHVVSPLAMRLRDRFVSSFKTMGVALGAGVVLVLLIACANVASAMLARSVFRRREMGIRVALGASSGRIMRQLLTESVLLAGVCSAIGAVIGVWGLRLLLSFNPDFLPRWTPLDVGPRTVFFSIAIVFATAILFGLVPALQLRGQDVRGTLTSAANRLTTSLRDRRLLDALVVAEVALAAVLLAGGGLLVRAYQNLRSTDPRFRAAGVAMFRVALPDAKYRNEPDEMRFYETLMDRLRAAPGVDHAAVITCPPFGCHWGNFYEGDGQAPLGKNEVDPVTLTHFASADYFATMGIQLAHGRFFAEHEGVADHKGFRPVVINEELAKRLWPNVGDPTGKRLKSRGDTSASWSTVVGVVRDVKHYGLERPMIPGLYFPLTRIDTSSRFDTFAYVLHTNGDPAALSAAIRNTVHALDPELPVIGLTTGPAAVAKSLAGAKTIALTLVTFAAIALTLAVAGIYAVLSYLVGRRRHEIGIRMALGARNSQVLALVIRQGLRLAAIGLAIGIPIALVATRALSSLLIGVKPSDPVTYVGVVIVLAGASALATWIPARRASRLEPKIALSEST